MLFLLLSFSIATTRSSSLLLLQETMRLFLFSPSSTPRNALFHLNETMCFELHILRSLSATHCNEKGRWGIDGTTDIATLECIFCHQIQRNSSHYFLTLLRCGETTLVFLFVAIGIPKSFLGILQEIYGCLKMIVWVHNKPIVIYVPS